MRTVTSLGVASAGTLRAGTKENGACTLRDAAGLGRVGLLLGAPEGGILTEMAGIGGSRGASDSWLGLLVL